VGEDGIRCQLGYAGGAGDNPGDIGAVRVTAAHDAADLIDQLRTCGTVITYDPDTRTIRAGDRDSIAVAASQNH
jgi:hypothetical protein